MTRTLALWIVSVAMLAVAGCSIFSAEGGGVPSTQRSDRTDAFFRGAAEASSVVATGAGAVAAAAPGTPVGIVAGIAAAVGVVLSSIFGGILSIRRARQQQPAAAPSTGPPVTGAA